jgi:heat shock protein HslJ
MRHRRLGAICAVLLLAIAGCSSPESSSDSTIEGSVGELQGTQWVLASYAIDGALTTVPDDQYADAEFTAGRVKGFSGCNQYDAVYRTGGRLLLVGVPAVTLMACPDATAAFETAYLTALQASRFYDIRNNHLTIRGPDRNVLLQFDAPPVNPLLGSWVVDSYESAPNTVSAPLPGTEMTAVFRFTNVGGSAGCNTYQGPYSLTNGVVAIGPLATTRLACPDDVLAQETAFLAAMQGVARVESRGQTLQLQDRDGHLVVALARPSTVEPSASPSVAPTATASASASASPSASPTAKPTASPSPTPTPTPKPTASPTPTASASPAPTIQPPASIPPLAQCTIPGASGAPALATMSYPSTWHTLTAPPNLACRYFDPNPITVPADPTTLDTAIEIASDPTVTYADALAAATNPTAWNVLTNVPVTISGLPAVRLQTTSTVGTPDVPVGSTRYGYLIDAGGKPFWIATVGTAGDPTFTSDSLVVDVMASKSTITPPAP